MLEDREAAGAGIPCAHIGSGAGVRHQLVTRETDAGARQNVGMEIDETWQDELTRSVECLGAPRRGNFRFDCCNMSVADADVAFASQVLAGIDQLAAPDDQVERVRRSKWHGLRLCLLDSLSRCDSGTSAQ